MFRYDGRGYLHDLKQFEATDKGDAVVALSEEDAYMEQICDEERYMALKKSIVEEELYHEEELKRLRAALADEGAYNQVGFSYEENKGSSQTEIDQEKEQTKADEEDEDFTPVAELNVPTGMTVPTTTKMNAIIEKTALFVSAHGPQMEIVIKAKQSANAQFAFLAFDDELNPYYKHMIQAIKLGKYVPQQTQPAEEEDDDSDEDGDDHYLHPSLLSSGINFDQGLMVPKLAYAKTGEDRYSLLVSQLKDKVLSGMQMVQESQTVGNGTVLKTDSPLPPPPGLVPVTLPSNESSGINNHMLNRQSGIPLVPPPDLLPIVDKMASYVAKNGEGFEMVVKSKGADSRFDFLKPAHQYYPYYQSKIKMFVHEMGLDGKDSTNSDGMNNVLDKDYKTGLVSFSIKMKEMSEKRNALVSEGSDGDEGGAESPSRKKVVEKVEGQNEDVEEVKVKIQAQEARQAEERIKDKLAAAARERLVQVSREKQLQMERKRKAALFLSLLQKGKEDDCNLIGPKLPTADELEVLVNGEGDLPLVPSASILPVTSTAVVSQSFSAAVTSTTGAPAVSTVSSAIVSSPSQGRVSPKVHSSPLPSHRRDDSRSRSRSVIKHKRRERSRSHSKERKSHKKKRRRRRSRSRSVSSHEHRSPSRSLKLLDSRKLRGSKTPPSAYYSSRTSMSPRHEFDKNRSNPKSYEKRHSHSRPRYGTDDKGRRSPSPRSSKRQGRSGFRSQTPSRSRSRSCSRRSHSSQSHSTSPYKSRSVIKR